jgi:hypothetical protein
LVFGNFGFFLEVFFFFSFVVVEEAKARHTARAWGIVDLAGMQFVFYLQRFDAGGIGCTFQQGPRTVI